MQTPTRYDSVVISLSLLILLGGFNTLLAGSAFTDENVRESGSAISQFVTGSIYIYSVCGIIKSRGSIKEINLYWPSMMLPALALCSAIWSPDPSLTIRRGVSLLGTNLFGVFIMTRYGLCQSAKFIIRSLCLGTFLSLVFAVLVPALGVHQSTDSGMFQPEHLGSWRGIFPHKSYLGGVIAGPAVGLLITCGDIAFSKKYMKYLAILVSLTCLIKSRSGAGILVAASLPGMWIGLRLLGPRSSGEVRLLTILLFIFTAWFFLTFGEIVEWILIGMGKQPDLTGRTPYWNLLLDLAQEHWFIGYGYFAGYVHSVGPVMLRTIGLEMVNAHNGYLETYVGLGLSGLSVLIIYLLLIVRKSVIVLFSENHLSYSTKIFPSIFIFYSLMINLSESFIIEPSNLIPIGLAAISACSIKREVKEPLLLCKTRTIA